MDPPQGVPPQETEAELERFRKQWQEEVQKKTRSTSGLTSTTANAAKLDRRREPAAPSASSSSSSPSSSSALAAPKSQSTRLDAHDGRDEHEPHTYHDLPDREAELRLDAADHGYVRGSSARAEPTSALEHYERAVEKETQGSLGDSLKHYRKAFKLDDRVHEQYKNKHFPPSSFPPKRPPPPPTQQKPAQPASSNASVTVPTAGNRSLDGTASVLPPSISQLVADFSQLSIPGAPPPTDASPPPPCPIAELPEELLSGILMHAATTDLASLSRIAQVCRRFAYLVMTDEQVWKRVAQGSEYGFAGMHYDYVCDLKGEPLDNFSIIEGDAHLAESNGTDDQQPAPQPMTRTTPDIDAHLLQSIYRSSWRQMFRQRPRLRFNGCYISTVNYTRPGAASTDSRTWGTPIHIVTYFRYLRFFRDGTAISLLTTTEPGDVVHHLTKENLHNHHTGALPSAVMKDGLRGRWRLSGPGDGLTPPSTEAEGDVHIETEGIAPKYMWKMQFALGSTGRKEGTRNNRLAWKGYWYYNRLTDDWGEFGLKNDKAFYFSRVRSYGMG